VGKTTVIQAYVAFLRNVACQKLLSRPTFQGVIQKIPLAQFFWDRV